MQRTSVLKSPAHENGGKTKAHLTAAAAAAPAPAAPAPAPAPAAAAAQLQAHPPMKARKGLPSFPGNYSSKFNISVFRHLRWYLGGRKGIFRGGIGFPPREKFSAKKAVQSC